MQYRFEYITLVYGYGTIKQHFGDQFQFFQVDIVSFRFIVGLFQSHSVSLCLCQIDSSGLKYAE